MEEEFVSNDILAQQAKTNTLENFKFGFEDAFLKTVIARMDQNKELFSKIMDDEEFNSSVKELLLKKVYDRLREAS
jgi:type I restriction enzyme, R subunit